MVLRSASRSLGDLNRSRGSSRVSERLARRATREFEEERKKLEKAERAERAANGEDQQGDYDEEGNGPPFKPTMKFYMAFVAISSLTLAAALDATSLSIALPALTGDLNGTALQSFWTGTAFFLASSIIMPIFAALSHIFGRKPCTQLGAIVFAAGSILGALAPTMVICIIGRAVQGIGAGIVVVLGEIIVTDLVPLNQRGKWLGVLGTMWTIGGVIGPLVGGVFAQFVSWRWVFWINVPFIVIGSVLLQIYLTQSPIPGGWFQKFLRVDWFGAALFTASVSALLIPITIGDVLLEWKDWRLIVPMFLGFDGLIAFIYYEKCHAKEPLVPLTIFGNWSVRSTYIQTIFHAIVFWGTFYYLPYYYQVIKQYGIFISSIAMLPQTIVVSPISVIVGILINKFNRFRWAIYSGWFCTTLGAGLLMLLDYNTVIPGWIFINVVLCLGLGTLIVAMNFAVQAAVEPKLCGHAVAFYVFLRQFGEGLGVAIGGVIFQNRLRQNLYSYPNWHNEADKYADKATTLGPVLGAMEAGPKRDELIKAFVDALKILWLVMCLVAAVGFAFTLLVRSHSMDKALDTQQGFVIEKRSSDSGEEGVIESNGAVELTATGNDHVYDRREWEDKENGVRRHRIEVHAEPVAAAP